MSTKLSLVRVASRGGPEKLHTTRVLDWRDTAASPLLTDVFSRVRVSCAGRVQKIIKTKLLLEQPYIRDPNMNGDELVKSYVSKLGENIKVARFVRFNVGEGAESPAEEE